MFFFRKKKERTEKIPRLKRIALGMKKAFLTVIGWDLLMWTTKGILRSWLRLAERDREIVENDTFEDACKRFEVTPEKLPVIMKSLKGSKRCYWVLFWVSVYFWIMGMGLIFLHGVTLSRMNMALVSISLMAVFAACSFKYAFRYWQCEIRKLGDVNEFWAAGGIKRIFQW
ncbi:hypothetical protein ACUUL3_07190 [Thiovibrio sp. JS02]